MKNNNDKIEVILDSFNDMSRAEISPFFKTKLFAQLSKSEQDSDATFERYVWFVTACICCLFFVNTALVFKDYSSNALENTNDVSFKETFKEIFYLNSTNTKYYDNY